MDSYQRKVGEIALPVYLALAALHCVHHALILVRAPEPASVPETPRRKRRWWGNGDRGH